MPETASASEESPACFLKDDIANFSEQRGAPALRNDPIQFIVSGTNSAINPNEHLAAAAHVPTFQALLTRGDLKAGMSCDAAKLCPFYCRWSVPCTSLCSGKRHSRLRSRFAMRIPHYAWLSRGQSNVSLLNILKLAHYRHQTRLGNFQDLPLDARRRAYQWLDRFIRRREATHGGVPGWRLRFTAGRQGGSHSTRQAHPGAARCLLSAVD
jgi:hypothetical protein